VWKIQISDKAYRQLKGYRHTPAFEIFDKVIHELQMSDDPTSRGTFKSLGDIRCYSYHVTRSLRLLYSVDRQQNLIIILGVGDHKAVYGKD
jgi:mRNA-degrading endonuclease RelE of RelBE toxin-antitoxin system